MHQYVPLLDGCQLACGSLRHACSPTVITSMQLKDSDGPHLFQVEPAQTPFSHKRAHACVQEALLDERRRLEEAIAQELKGKGPAAAAPAPQQPAQAPGGSGSGGAERLAPEEGGEEEGDEGGVDALDAFMSDVKSQIEQDKVGALEHWHTVASGLSYNFALPHATVCACCDAIVGCIEVVHLASWRLCPRSQSNTSSLAHKCGTHPSCCKLLMCRA